MSQLVLTGLVGSHPLGALAAFGLLRSCEELNDFRGSRLGWTTGEGYAVLDMDREVSPAELTAALAGRQQGRHARPELTWSDTIKVKQEPFQEVQGTAKIAAAEGRRDLADFLTAYGCELCVDESGTLEPTPFYMTSGQQQFLKEARNLARCLAAGVRVGRRAKGTEEMFNEALFGPWRYEDAQHSLGWDPATERLHALMNEKPSKSKNLGVTAAVWLAFEALPLFPCFLSKGHLETTGFCTQGQLTYLTWPLWEVPLPLATVRSLLTHAELAAASPRLRELRPRGIRAVFRSERYKVKTQGGYYILRTACPCA